MFSRCAGIDPERLSSSLRRAPLVEEVVLVEGVERPTLFGSQLLQQLGKADGMEAVDAMKKRAAIKPPYVSYKPKRLVTVLTTDMKPLVPEIIPVGGKFARFLEAWVSLGAQREVINWIKGLELEFATKPKVHTWLGPVRVVKHVDDQLSLEVAKMLEKGALEEVRVGQPVHLSHFFSVPKADGGIRPIISLKGVNRFLETKHFKMEGLKCIPDLVGKGDWLGKIDAKDAYFHVRVAPETRKYLAFQFRDKAYQFKAMPFGLNIAPRVFTKIMKPVLINLRARGIKCICYLDDLLIVGESESQTLKDINTVLKLFGVLGITVNESKSHLTPTRVLNFLGLGIDTVRHVFTIPAQKDAEIKDLLSGAIGETWSARRLAGVLGKANAISLAAPWLHLFLREAEVSLKKVVRPRDPTSFDLPCPLSEEAKEDVRVALSLWPEISDAPISRETASIVITSDASNKGWGAVCGRKQTGGQWTVLEKALHINVKELTAAWFGLLCFASEARNCTILLEMDNTAAVAYVRNFAGTRSKKLRELAKLMWHWALERNVWLEAIHRAGKDNTVADGLSRNFSSNREWSLEESVVRELFRRWGQPSVDLFASRLNNKLPKFFSLNPDPQAEGTDAFKQNWSGLYGYAFPPSPLVGRTLRKALKDRCSLIIIAPWWPGQHWFPLLKQCAVEAPVVLTTEGALLKGPSGELHPLEDKGSLRLCAWKISPSSG